MISSWSREFYLVPAKASVNKYKVITDADHIRTAGHCWGDNWNTSATVQYYRLPTGGGWCRVECRSAPRGSVVGRSRVEPPQRCAADLPLHGAVGCRPVGNQPCGVRHPPAAASQVTKRECWEELVKRDLVRLGIGRCCFEILCQTLIR